MYVFRNVVVALVTKCLCLTSSSIGRQLVPLICTPTLWLMMRLTEAQTAKCQAQIEEENSQTKTKEIETESLC